MKRRSRVVLGLALALAPALVAVGWRGAVAGDGAEDDPGGDGWRVRPPPAWRPRPEPPAFEVERDDALGTTLREVPDRAAAALVERLAAGPEARSRWRRGRGPLAGPLGGVEDARRRLRGLSPGARAAAAEAQAEAAAQLLAEARDELAAARREVVDRLPLAPQAAPAARALGDAALERGAVEEALLWYRLAGRGEARTLDARLLALRARPGTRDRAGGVGLDAPDPGPCGVRWAREAMDLPAQDVAADGVRVVVADGRGALALDRADGRARWRHVDADVVGGLPRAAGRLALAPDLGAAVLVRPRVATALDLGTGAPRFAVTLEALLEAAHVAEARGLDEVTATAPTPDGLALLAVVGGLRALALVDPRGAVRGVAALWPVAPPATTVQRPAPVALEVVGQEGRALVVAPRAGEARPCEGEVEDEAGRARPCRTPLRPGQGWCPVCGFTPRVGVGLRFPEGGALRAVTGDGRLAALADRVVVVADGLVAAVGARAGEPRWLLERGPGLGLDGAVPVDVSARAFGVEALTAAGLVVRVDPLDGAPLPPPPRPAWAGEDLPGVLLALDPVVVGWGLDARQVVLAIGAGARRGPALVGGARPVAPGLALGPRLLLPAAAGLVEVDLAAPGADRVVERPALPWPLPTPPRGEAPRWRLAPAPGGALAWGPAGVVLLEPGAGAPGGRPDDAAARPPADAAAAARALDDPGWAARLAGWRALRADPGAAVAALDAVARGGPAPGQVDRDEVRVVLAARAWRRALLARVAPAAPAALVERLLGGLAPEDVVRLRPHVRRGAEARDALLGALRAASDPALRAALADLALRADDALCGRLVAQIRTADRAGVKRAAADVLVELANDGLDTPARRALVHPDAGTRAMVQAALLAGAGPAVRERLQPAKYWEELEEPLLRAFGLGGPPVADADDRAACWTRLVDALTEE